MRSCFRGGRATALLFLLGVASLKRLFWIDIPAVTETAAICALVINEEAYLDEWVDYYVALGFSEIYLYDNSPDHDLQQWGLTKKEVTVIHYPGKAKQRAANLDCAKKAQKKHTWAAFFDADEYLVLKKHGTVVELLRDHCTDGALSINWLIMCSSGHQVYEPKPVTKRFQCHDGGINPHIKSIARLQDMNMTLQSHVHYPYLLEGRYLRDTNGNILEGPEKHFNERKPTDVALLYHYSKKSWKEYIDKRLRGRSDVNDKAGVENLVRQARAGVGICNGTILDDTVWEAVKKYNPKYAVFDKSSTVPVAALARNTGQNESVAICCLAGDDEAYIDEWVDYHYAIGFEHIYIYDPSDRFYLQQWGEEKGDQVTVYRYASNHSQDDAYLDCARSFGLSKNHTWMAFFNVDEFLVLRKHSNVLDMLRNDPRSCAVAISSVLFGTGGQQVYHPHPVTKRFVHRSAGNYSDGHHTLKTFMRLKDMNLLDKTHGMESICERVSYQDSKVAVRHRYIRSMKECRASRSSENIESETKAVGDVCTIKGSIFDDSAWKTLKQNVPWYALLEQDFYESQRV